MNDINIAQPTNPVNPQDNFSQELDALAEKAREKIEDWHKGDKTEKSGKAAKKLAVIEYGAVLLEGRGKHLSDKVFGQWIKASKLDTPPYRDHQERSNAMRVAELTVGSAPYSSFDACPNTTPSDMLKWARKTGLVKLKPKPTPPPKSTTPAKPPVPAMSQPQSQAAITKQFVKQFKREEDIAKGIPVPPLPLDKETEKHIAQQVQERADKHTNLPKKDRHTLEKALASEAKKVVAEGRAYKEKVDVDARKHIDAEVNRRLALQFPDYEKRLAIAREREAHYHKLIEAVKIPLTMQEYSDVVLCCHPDNPASKDKRHTTSQMLNAKKFQLTGKK
jgi:hypothetical protein